MHFKHNSAKIQPKNLKLVHYSFLAVQSDIQLEGAWVLWASLLATPLVYNISKLKTRRIKKG